MVHSVTIIVGKAPYGHEHVYGAIYTAIASQEVGLPIILILIGDGVYSALKGQASEASIGYPSLEKLLQMLGSNNVLVEELSLLERKIQKKSLIDGVKITREKEIFKTILEGQAILTY